MTLTIRSARPGEAGLVLAFIREHALHMQARASLTG